MDRGQADVLVSDLAKQLGIATLAFDENGMCVLALEEGDESVVVSIGHNPGAGSIDLMACLHRVEPSPARIAAALMANFDTPRGGGVTLAAEGSTGAFIVQRRYFGPDLGDGGLPEAVVSFVDDATAWTERLTAIDDELDEEVAAAGAHAPVEVIRG
jgi:Tir chaperone protein (CesT) family